MPDSNARCIGIDWGTTRLRAYLIGGSGEILARHASDAGVAGARGEFERIFARELGGWLEAHPRANVTQTSRAEHQTTNGMKRFVPRM